ncbi:hypothetical protein LPJ66_007025 [Kickxella alabastrina]|uniref:Uncharacterized protein n=1 Tax=Kickxella alabastrina TaxID=61397 RepID=A0ACC1IBH5_9FUNG|nr:hypothetical protein LPJ66_007025 [Kickxella alabastrina]
MSPVEGIPTVAAAAIAVPVVETAKPVTKPTAEATTPVPTLSAEAAERIVTQVKHYFSDANLTHDTYMRRGAEMNEGWVTFTTLARFNRLRQLMGLEENKPQRPIKAARGSGKFAARPEPVPQAYVDLLAATVKAGVLPEDSVEVMEDGSALRRKETFELSEDWFGRTVHVKGLAYGKENGELIEELTKYFTTAVGNVELVRLRRNPKTKAFKGNVLVQFGSSVSAEEAAKKEGLEFDGQKLEIVTLEAYHDEKLGLDEFIQPELRKPQGEYPSFEDWCKAHGRPVPAPLKGEKGKKSEAAAVPEYEIVPGSLVKFTGASGELGFAALREAFGVSGDVKFVDYEKGQTEGIVRFKEPVAATVIESNPEGVVVGECTLALVAVGDEEEKAFYERAKASAAASRNGNNKRPGNNSSSRGRAKRFRK